MRLTVGSLEVAKPRDSGLDFFQSLWSLPGTSAAALPQCLSNIRTIPSLWHPISRLRDFTRSCGNSFYHLVNRGPGVLFQFPCLPVFESSDFFYTALVTAPSPHSFLKIACHMQWSHSICHLRQWLIGSLFLECKEHRCLGPSNGLLPSGDKPSPVAMNTILHSEMHTSPFNWIMHNVLAS